MESANCQILSALPQPSEKPTDVRERCLYRAVENAVHLLPAQGPIGVFD
jgi:hypothetical protein